MIENNIALSEAQMKLLDVVATLDDAVELDGLRQVVCNYLQSQWRNEPSVG